VNTVIVAIVRQRRCPALRPSLGHWQPGSLGGILRPSSHYMLLASANVLAYQVPLLLMQRILGPDIVTVFSLTRTVYSMSRRVLYLVTNSLSAEITLVVGQKDWPRLQRLYELSERVILMLTPPITFGSMLATPLLLQLWLHKGLSQFHPGICLTLGVTVSVLSIKEHKYQFQFSSNQIGGISWQTLLIYGATALLSIPLMSRWGIQGYLVAWLVSETLQLFYLLHLNDRLFAGHGQLNHAPVRQLLLCLAGCTVLLYWPEHHIQQLPFVWQGVASLALFVALGAFCYRVFGLAEVREMFWKKLTARFQPAGV
jgi:O-antigen/teichoic acid export membrane protein